MGKGCSSAGPHALQVGAIGPDSSGPHRLSGKRTATPGWRGGPGADIPSPRNIKTSVKMGNTPVSESHPLSHAEILDFLRDSRRCPMCSREVVRESEEEGRFFYEYACGHRVYLEDQEKTK
jgi:hypothetical protein